MWRMRGSKRGKGKEEGPSRIWKVEGMGTRRTNENTKFRPVEFNIKMTGRVNLVAEVNTMLQVA
jgi:hypothetical protein